MPNQLSHHDLQEAKSYHTPLSGSPLLPLLLLSLMKQKSAPKTATCAKEEYDYVVVGAGAAGSVVASRLSEKPCVSVLLLEAGKAGPSLTDIPGFTRSFWGSDLNWDYKTEPQRNTGNAFTKNEITYPQGKVTGGTSTFSFLLYTRGNKKNYDDWDSQGAKGWSYKDVYPYFLKLENNKDQEFLHNGYHHKGGPLTVQKPSYYGEVKPPVFEAIKEMGYKVVDPNGPETTGFYEYQGFIDGAQRTNAAKAYLVPAEDRPNLDILPNAFVRKVIIENGQATGVEYELDGHKEKVKAKKEVILSAGAINTPQILMLSGIGPQAQLRKHKIPLVADLPVGKNLQDHFCAFLDYEMDPSIPDNDAQLNNQENVLTYICNRSGPLGSPAFLSAVGFINLESKDPKSIPDYELYVAEVSYQMLKEQLNLKKNVFDHMYRPYEGKPLFLCAVNVLQPKSRGTVELQSNDPKHPPAIDPNYYSNPDDLKVIVEGLKFCHELISSKSLKKIKAQPLNTTYPECEGIARDTDAYYRCVAKSSGIPLGGLSGTCRMGDPKDSTTVVDPTLKVKGVKGLRVADASIMPSVPSGNTYAPTVMIGEKAADMIKQTINCPSQG